MTPTLARRLAACLRTGHRQPTTPLRVRRVVTGDPTPTGAVEAAVVVERDGRVSALAVRLERHQGAWRAIELTAPEAGLRPLVSSIRPDAFDEVAAEQDSAERAELGRQHDPSARRVTGAVRRRGIS